MTERFWIIRQQDNDLYFADVRPDRVWTSDPFFANRYRSEEVALNLMIEQLNGKGQAVEIVIPSARGSTARGPYGPPRGAYAPDALDVFKL